MANEVIKTTLTGDSSELRAEFAKASAAALDYQKRQQEGFKRAASGSEQQLRVLRLEAAGLKDLAATARQNIAVREQAQRLAVQANLTEQQAMAIVRQRLALQNQVAQAAAQEAAQRQRAAAIANPRATGLPGGGGQLAPLTPGSLAQMDRAIAQQRELRRQTLAAGRSGYTGAMGFLAFSQAVEDAQYGVRGILNNIPQMVLGFGGGVGLAGALSLAAVAAVALYPAVKRLYGVMDNEILKKAGEEWERVFSAGINAANAQLKNTQAARDLAAASERTNEIYRERVGYASGLLKNYDEELKANREARDLANEILKARIDTQRVAGGDLTSLRNEEKTKTLEGLQSDLKNRNEQLKLAEAEVARLSDVRKNVTGEIKDGEAVSNRVRDLEADLASMQANLVQSEKERAEMDTSGRALGNFLQGAGVLVGPAALISGKAMEDTAKDQMRLKNELYQNKLILEPKIQKRKLEIEQAKAEEAQLPMRRENLQIAIKNAEAAQETLNKAFQETKVLEKQIAQQKALNAIAERRRQIEANIAAQNKAGAELTKQYEQDERDYAEGIKRGRQALEQRAARAEFGAEIRALQLQLQGRSEVADKLRLEMQLRAQSVEEAKRLGISEAAALNVLRERARLMERVEAMDADKRGGGGGRRRGVRRLANGANDFNAGNNLAQWQWRLGPQAAKVASRGSAGRFLEEGMRGRVLDRRARERAADAPKPVDPTLKALERSNDLQAEMLGVFKRLRVF